MGVGLGKQLKVPQDIANTYLRPDLVLWREAQQVTCFVKLTV